MKTMAVKAHNRGPQQLTPAQGRANGFSNVWPHGLRCLGMRWAAIPLIAVFGACAAPLAPLGHSVSPSSPIAATSPARQARNDPSASPIAAPPSPWKLGATPPPISQVGFTCRLPFVRQLDVSHWQAGFLSFPRGTFSADEKAGSLRGYYDQAVSKWLPVGRSAVAPDGLRYAYLTGGFPSPGPGPPRLHVVAAASGVETIIELHLPAEQPYGVEDFAADGIYVGSSWEGVVIGHWRVDPASGGVVALGTGEELRDDGTGHSLRAVVDRRDPEPATSAMSGDPLPNEIVRRDLKTSADEVWFYRPGFSLAVAGTFVGGGHLVWAEAGYVAHPNSAHEYWLVSGPGRSHFVGYLEGGGQEMADSHGIWMGSSEGLFLFTLDGRLRRVSDVLGYPANGCV